MNQEASDAKDSPREIDNPHALEPDELFEKLDSDKEGLSSDEASERLKQWGANELPTKPPTPAWLRWLRQFHSLFIYVLLVSAAVSAAIGHLVDAAVIVAVVVVNATIGFVQEGKAERALQAIKSMSRSESLVRRDGDNLTVDSRDLVPGDIVTLEAGERVPADLRLIENEDLRCDEAMLTGESEASEKSTDKVDDETSLAERAGMAYMGTLVTAGKAQGLVTHTGANTEIGAINRMVQGVELTETPLQKQLRRLAQHLTLAILAFTALTAVFGIWVHGNSAAEMFRGAIGIAVAAIPQGLPAIVTVALALGVERMAHQKALMRRLPAVEVLGSVDVICSDKTGTLTTNEMTAGALVTSASEYRIKGEGYSPEGEIKRNSGSDADAEDEQLAKACRIAMLCNDAEIYQEDDDWRLQGDPTEGALMVLALKQGLATEEVEDKWPRIATLPFESEKRYMATLHNDVEGEREMAIKGAPDRLIERCEKQLGPDGPEDLDQDYWNKQIDALADKGMRVIGLAYKPVGSDKEELEHQDMESGLVMVALAGLSDPPRPESIDAIAQCHNAGIRVVMITGDNPTTAAAIGRELGLKDDKVVTGADWDKADNKEQQDMAESADIFARTSPKNKLELMEALQGAGHTVSMTGDGVNDSPALRGADIGVAMGRKGTDAAKEASDFVLVDDNFATISRAVAEGRKVYDNIVKSIVFVLPTNLAEASVIVGAILFGWVMPITPLQILWVNMVTAVTLAVAIGFEGAEANIMKRPPRPREQGLISQQLLLRILLVGGLGAAIVFGLFRWQLGQQDDMAHARSLAVNALVMFEIFYLLTARTLNDAVWDKRYWQGMRPALVAIALVLVFQLAFTYWPWSQELFGVAALSGGDWLLITVATSPVLVLAEIHKGFMRRWRDRKS